MLAGIHFFSSSIIALKFLNSPFIALIFGFFLHHLEDILPHLDLNIFNKPEYESIKNWDFKAFALFILEFSFFFLLTFYFLGKFPLNKQLIAFWAGIGALLPDIISFSLKSFFPKLKIFNFYLNFHKKYHFQLKARNFTDYFKPILIEFLIIAFCLYLVNISH